MSRKPCIICGLSEEVRRSLDAKITLGLPGNSLVEYLGTLGISVTPQQIYNHKRHSKPDGTNPSPVSLSRPQLIARVSEDGLSSDDRQEKLLGIALEAVDTLVEQFKDTSNLRVAKMLKEMGEWASQLVKDRMARETLPEPMVSVVIQMTDLEDTLELSEYLDYPTNLQETTDAS